MFFDFTHQAGFSLTLDTEPSRLIFGEDVQYEGHVEKTRAMLALVWAKPGLAQEGTRSVYSVFWGVAQKKDAPLWEGHSLRYDITFIPPGKIGQEFPKTFGHIHRGSSSLELYQVLHGRIWALLEQWEGNASRPVLLVEAGVGEIFVVPPQFGHVAINPFDESLVVANVIARDTQQDYSPYEKQHGGSYYVVASEFGSDFIDIIPNPNRAAHPTLVKVRPRLGSELQFLKGAPLYHVLHTAKSHPGFMQLSKIITEPYSSEQLLRTFFHQIS